MQRPQTSVAGVVAAFAVMIDCKLSGSAAMAISSLGAKRSQTGQMIAPISPDPKVSSAFSMTFCIQNFKRLFRFHGLSENSLSRWERVGERAYGKAPKKNNLCCYVVSS